MNKYSNIENYKNIDGNHYIDFSKATGIRFALITEPVGEEPYYVHDLCLKLLKDKECGTVIFTSKEKILDYIEITINALKMERHQLEYDLQVLKGLNRPWDERDEPIKESTAYLIEQVNLSFMAIWNYLIGKIDAKEAEIEEKQKQRKNLEKIKQIIEKE